ncbi:hypothetical protein ACQPYE_05675 [Actinosynnema sp. CA-299493]
MSEYQYYEFLAIDRPLNADEQAEIRTASTRATITATGFVNEYHWGDFKGDTDLWMEHYYDAHLHVTNWGTRRVMFRLPSDLLDPEVVDEYCVDDRLAAWTTGESVVLDFVNEDHSDDDVDIDVDSDEDTGTLLSTIVGVRAELATGDLRPLYLAWLAAYGTWERDEDAFDRDADDNLEPPVPPGLTTLTEAQRALSDFLRLDDDLLATAAVTSPPLTEPTATLTAWVAALPTAEKNRVVERVVRGETARLRMNLLHRFHRDTAPTTPGTSRRTVGALLDDAARRRADR